MRGSKGLGVIVLTLAMMFIATVQAQSEASPPEGDEKPLDTVLLKNGSRILGNITSARDGVIVIETNFSEAINIDTAEVESMHSGGSMVVLMADGSTIRDQPIAVDKNGIEVTMPNGELRAYGVTEFDILSPEPWELGDFYKAFGLVSVAWALEEGNTVTDELDYKVESFWRSLEDRYTLKLYGELDEANGVKNADNNQVIGKYDYFLDGSDYWGR